MTRFPSARESAKKIMRLFEPPERLRTSEWADAHRRLSPESSAEPGQWRTTRTPYLREPMNALCEDGVSDVTCVFASQLGKSEYILNDIGRTIHLDPAPILVILPTLEMADAWSEDRLGPMLRDTPVLRERVDLSKGHRSKSKKRHKVFHGGVLTVAGANSASSLSMRAIRHLRCDEVDRFPLSAASEGDPIAIAEARTSTFYNRTIIKISSPTDEETSRIWLSYLETDQRQYHVPCPYCKKYQRLAWENVFWPENNYAEIHYLCSGCKRPVPESHKPEMLAKGRWVRTVKSAPKNKVGFWLSAVYSPWVSWAKLAQEFDEAKRSRKAELLKVFVNTRLAEVWRDTVDGFDAQAIYMRRERYKAEVPAQVLVLVCGMDVQDDRIEAEVVGYSHDDESWGIDYRVIWGDPADMRTWLAVDEFLQSTFQHEHGYLMEISSTCIDSRGHHSGKVWDFCARRKHRNIFAIHGIEGENRAIVGTAKRPQTGKNRRRCVVFPIGTYEAKTALYSALRLPTPGPSYCHFPVKDCYNDDYFKQLTSEVKKTVYKNGYPAKQWILPDGRRNEALDCRVYAMGALVIARPNYRAIEERMAKLKGRKRDGGEEKEREETEQSVPFPPSGKHRRHRGGRCALLDP